MNRKLRSAARAAAMAVVVSTMAVACGSVDSTKTTVGAGITTMWALSGGNQTVTQKAVKSWNAVHPGEKIDVNFFASDAYKTKIRTAVGAGEGPTLIFGWGGGVLKSYVDSRQVDDLSPWLAQNPEVRDRYLPSVLDNGIINGKTYALPSTFASPSLLFFNKDLFAKVGATPPKTWDELMALVPKFRKAGIAPFVVAGQSKWPYLPWFSYLVDRIGGPGVFQKIVDGRSGAWSDPAVTDALKKIQALVDAGGFVKGSASISTDSRSDQALLFTGRAAMVLHFASMYQNLKGIAPEFVADGKLGYTAFPAVSGGKGDPTNLVGNPSHYVSVSSKATANQKKTALDFLKNGLYTDTYTENTIKSGAVPVVQDVEDKLAVSPEKDYLSFVYDAAKNAPTFTPSWDQALNPGEADALLANLELIFLKEISPAKFVSTMNSKIGA